MITGIIMASGFSKRMNKDKLTLNLGGELVIEKVIKAAKESKLDEIILVYQKEHIKDIAIKYGIKTVFNSCPEKGQSESMKLGIKSSNLNTEAFMFIVGDQPLLNSRTIDMMIDAFNNDNSEILVPMYNNEKGSPTIFSSKLKDKLLEVEGDKGGRKIIEKAPHMVKYISIEDYRVGLDMDTWDEYQQLIEMEMEIEK
ncbi:molybdenum cofactor cytidylyltransferase [Proteiniborus sp. MB09-C3]|uniref:molybdenum cofactor cytidylyltransferase n=1 Tax=Proteiniborus sp. MB09-C3 TaxID=3050072 RepID=UPI0025566E18|nr:molybdenum cofactor cytidylyltransferase [Proteiniborus sp. MB09-C3]WIV12547.1 molybdenum cofactor cytidylyltransferase [Proteiniborus sp. MB09-C3]